MPAWYKLLRVLESHHAGALLGTPILSHYVSLMLVTRRVTSIHKVCSGAYATTPPGFRLSSPCPMK